MANTFDSIFNVEFNHDYDNIEITSGDTVDVTFDTEDDFITRTNVSVSRNYNDLTNKPSINGITLIGDRTIGELFSIDVIDCGTSTEVL